MTISRPIRSARTTALRHLAFAALSLSLVAGLPLAAQAEWETDPASGVSLAGLYIMVSHSYNGNDVDFTCHGQADSSGPEGAFTCNVTNAGGTIEGEIVGITHTQVYSIYNLPTIDGHRIRFVRDVNRDVREIYEGSIGWDDNGYLWMAGEFKREETRRVCAGRLCQVQTVTDGPNPFRGAAVLIGG